MSLKAAAIKAAAMAFGVLLFIVSVLIERRRSGVQ